jgi:hypothetical protein
VSRARSRALYWFFAVSSSIGSAPARGGSTPSSVKTWTSRPWATISVAGTGS